SPVTGAAANNSSNPAMAVAASSPATGAAANNSKPETVANNPATGVAASSLETAVAANNPETETGHHRTHQVMETIVAAITATMEGTMASEVNCHPARARGPIQTHQQHRNENKCINPIERS